MAQTLAHLGQRYQAPPAASFDDRFGPYQSGPMTEQELLRRLYEQQMLQQPGAVVPGYQERFGDPTKVISQLGGDVTDSGIPTPRYVPPTPDSEDLGVHVLQGEDKKNMPSQQEIDATIRAMERIWQQQERTPTIPGTQGRSRYPTLQDMAYG